jgi:hypothetical protein
MCRVWIMSKHVYKIIKSNHNPTYLIKWVIQLSTLIRPLANLVLGSYRFDARIMSKTFPIIKQLISFQTMRVKFKYGELHKLYKSYIFLFFFFFSLPPFPCRKFLLHAALIDTILDH